MRIIWSAPARTDLELIYDFIAQENPFAAAMVVRRIRDRVLQLERMPRIGRIGRVENTRKLVVSRTPYIVAYRIDEGRISIIRVIHGRPSGRCDFDPQNSGLPAAQSLSLPRKTAHCANWSSATNSSGLCACSMSPGPQTTAEIPARWKCPPSVP